MSLADSGNTWSRLGGILGTYVLPALGGGQTNDRSATVEERLRYNGLNGSGPNDATQARKAPTNFLEFLFGRQSGDAVTQPSRGTAAATAGFGNGKLLLLVALVAVGAVWLWKRL